MKNSGNNITIPIQEISVAYNDWGNSTIPLIFIHGFPFDKSTWDEQLASLKTVCRVIAYDIRGFGKTTNNNQEVSIHLLADDLIDFMDALQIDKAIICGLSMGGYIVLNAISRYQHRFAGIVLCDTQCISDTSTTREKRYASIDLIAKEGTSNYAKAFVKNMFTTNAFEQNKPYINDIENIILQNNSTNIINGLKALANREATCDILPSIKIPTLIICGKEDIVTPIEQAVYFKEHIPNAVLVLLENAAHLSNIEQPALFNKAIQEFITDLLN
ncbi:MAG: alpha/beta fold hydrolase [Chitinophagaceae bacterium]